MDSPEVEEGYLTNPKNALLERKSLKLTIGWSFFLPHNRGKIHYKPYRFGLNAGKSPQNYLRIHLHGLIPLQMGKLKTMSSVKITSEATLQTLRAPLHVDPDSPTPGAFRQTHLHQVTMLNHEVGSTCHNPLRGRVEHSCMFHLLLRFLSPHFNSNAKK